ncbi:endonuclease iii [hydrocarbon metagenome]|uniref:Endonuclease iii n=1 Tax=hydrocarbon metagenome TaxID=938273 RepID=A0A0W8E4F7_9ZZZZ
MRMSVKKETVTQIYRMLFRHYGPRGWWPGESRLEIIVGAILTQAVAWKNVEKAIHNLKMEKVLAFQPLLNMPEEDLATLIKPALYNRQKAKKIKAMMNFIAKEYNGELDFMFKSTLPDLREKLLGIWGIGPETADSILLYAGNMPIFVVDAYTIRIFSRLGMVDENISYQQMQNFMHENVESDIYIYNEYHALLVALGADCCRKKNADCLLCPITSLCKRSSHLQE